MFQIGNIKIDNKIVLAPMAGICSSGYRRIIKEMGCGLIYAEMVSDKAIYYGSKKTIDMLYMTDMERPITQQIFGSDKESFVIAAKYICEKMKPDIIDINMGCPVPKVALRAQAGSALLKDPDKVEEIVKAVVAAVDIPVTVKIRSGWDFNSINAVEIAKRCEKAGARAIAVHGRTRSQGYSGKVNLDVIKDVKASVNIPVIGNGDVTSYKDMIHMLEYTKCDAVMIGRGVLGNPWLIKECVDYLKDSSLPKEVSIKEKFDMIRKHLEYLMESIDEKTSVLQMRTQISYYLKGIKVGNEIKSKFFKLTTKEEVFNLLDEYEQLIINEL